MVSTSVYCAGLPSWAWCSSAYNGRSGPRYTGKRTLLESPWIQKNGRSAPPGCTGNNDDQDLGGRSSLRILANCAIVGDWNKDSRRQCPGKAPLDPGNQLDDQQ